MGKLSTVERKKFVYEKLGEQRHLLRKSVEEIVAGDLTEALRVATTIRVLIHETGSSAALLKQLDQSYLQFEILDRDETHSCASDSPFRRFSMARVFLPSWATATHSVSGGMIPMLIPPFAMVSSM